MGTEAESPRRASATGHDVDVDAFGLPLDAFGNTVQPDFFQILGRLVAVNGQIEYLQDRFDHLPNEETSGVRKVEQFERRSEAGRADRNAVVHSRWVFGAHADPAVVVGIRYKTRRQTSGTVAAVSIIDVSGSERKQDVVEHTVESLRGVLRRDVATMRIGQLALSEIMLRYAASRIESAIY
ncbi:hypothetical protein [Rathayibacter sp. AY1D1]|uniref:hypothetical protein n=1 Tax=Rathayibacter sp. AY1D1 TaxID=2080542 RepID=UPI0011B094F1|nr:hypothetical protein [Rathayibacter sp. AY1D1]